MKLSGGILVLIGAVLLGTVISSRLKKRVEILESIEIFISSVSMEIEFAGLQIYEIMKKTILFESCKGLDFISICLKKMENGEDFSTSWVSGVEGTILPLRAEEKEKLKSLGSLIGTSDIEGQRAMLSLYGGYFSVFCNKARQDYEKYGNASITLSVLMGAGFLILML